MNMKKPDDHTLEPEDIEQIRKFADKLLRSADAYDRFPTPIEELVESAQLTIERRPTLDEGFVRSLLRSARIKRDGVLRAVGKLLGILDTDDQTIHLRRDVHHKKLPFLLMHETGHNYLPWQRSTYVIIQDSKETLDPEIKQLFERQANVFASEVLFQRDSFEKLAADLPFGIDAPVQLADRFGASIYSSLRRYVSTGQRACALLVLNAPQHIFGKGMETTLRRHVESEKFRQLFGIVNWKESFGVNHIFSQNMPIVGVTSQVGPFRIVNRHGKTELLWGESFNNSYQTFVMLYPESELPKRRTGRVLTAS
jgi:hypothetical protein